MVGNCDVSPKLASLNVKTPKIFHTHFWCLGLEICDVNYFLFSTSGKQPFPLMPWTHNSKNKPGTRETRDTTRRGAPPARDFSTNWRRVMKTNGSRSLINGAVRFYSSQLVREGWIQGSDPGSCPGSGPGSCAGSCPGSCPGSGPGSVPGLVDPG